VHHTPEPLSRPANHRLNDYIAILVSVAALATSWAGYQASVWNGEQASHGVQATTLRTSSTRASTHAGQLAIVDVELFTSWLDARTSGKAQLATFYEQRFRPEFLPAFRTWVASRPLTTPGAPRSPFALPEYRLADEVEASRLARAADDESAASQHANRVSDGYVLNVVLLQTVMLFATAVQQGTVRRLRIFLVGVAVVLCVASLYRLFTAPVA
jgi:hypothetical protein